MLWFRLVYAIQQIHLLKTMVVAFTIIYHYMKNCFIL